MPVLATAGSAGCGKDTVADFLEKQAQERGQRVVRLKFAGALRQDLIDGTPEVQTFWRQLYRSLTAPDFSSLMDEPVLPAKFWDKCLPGFSELRERTRAIIKFNESASPQATGSLPISTMLAPVPSDVINTDDRSIKESPSEACGGLSPRTLMQAYGSYMRNAVDVDYWTNRLVQSAKSVQQEAPDALIIVTDLRYENEAKAVRELLDGQVVHIVRPDSENALHGAAAKHESEAGVAVKAGDVVITNSGTLEQLREATVCIMRGEDHPLLSRETLWGTPQTLATAWKALQATGSIDALAQGLSSSELLKNNNSLLNTPPDQIAVTAPHAALEMETLLETSRRLAERSPMGTVLQVLAERMAMGDYAASNVFGPVYSCAGVADRAAEALSEALNPNVFQGHMNAVIERAMFCQAVANGDKEHAALTLETMLEPFFDDIDHDFCEQLAQEVIEQPLRECANAPHSETLQWLQRTNEGGEAAPAIFTKDSSAAITAVLCYEPRADVAHAAVQSLLERGDELLNQAQHSIPPTNTQD